MAGGEAGGAGGRGRHRARRGRVPDGRRLRRIGAAALAALLPGTAGAHPLDQHLGAFGGALLFPFQTLALAVLLTGLGVALSGVPRPVVRRALAAHGLAAGLGLLTVWMSGRVAGLEPAAAVLTLALGLAVAGGVALPERAAMGAAAVAGALVGLGSDLPPRWEVAAEGAAGLLAGFVLMPLIAWGAFAAARRVAGPVAPRVAGSWVAAIGLLTLVLALR